MSFFNILSLLSRFNSDYNPLIASRKSRPPVKQDACMVPDHTHFPHILLLLCFAAFLIVLTVNKWKIWIRSFEKSLQYPSLSDKYSIKTETSHESTPNSRIFPFCVTYPGISYFEEQKELETCLENKFSHHFLTLKGRCVECGKTDIQKFRTKMNFALQLLKESRGCSTCREAGKFDKSIQTDSNQTCLMCGFNQIRGHKLKNLPNDRCEKTSPTEFCVPLKAVSRNESGCLRSRKLNVEIEFDHQVRLA